MNSYYEILGVSRTASKDEIKSAYIKALKKFHPDVYTGDEKFAQETTAKLNEIYDILKDDEKRKIYDNSLLYSSKPNYYYSNQSSDTTTGSKNKKDGDDLFKEFKKFFNIKLRNKENINNNKKIKNNEIKKEKPKKEKIKKEKISKNTESLENKGNEKDEDKNLNLRIYIVLGLIALLFLIVLIF